MITVLRIILICLTVAGSMAGALEPEELAEARKLRQQYFNSGMSNYQNVRKLSPAQRELMVAYFRSAISGPKRKDEPGIRSLLSENVLNLALLGDDWAREQVVKDFWREGGKSKANQLCYLKDPKVIPMIGGGLFMEDAAYIKGDVIFESAQINLAEAVLDIAGHSPEFSADVNNWARRVERKWYTHMEIALEIVRDWYRANEAKLKAGDFKSVQPGAEPPETKQSAAVPTQPAPSAPLAAGRTAAPAKSPGSAAAPFQTGRGYVWIAALLVAISGSLIWLFWRNRK